MRREASPITGAIVVADVVLKRQREAPARRALKGEILKPAATRWRAHKVPAAISFVPALESPRPASWRGAMASAPTRNVLVTGGSRGLGLAHRATSSPAPATASSRWRATEGEELTAAIAEAERASAGALHFLPFDLGNIDGIPELVQELRKEFGPLYGLVNNAGARAPTALLSRHAQLADRGARAPQHTVADRADQICGALDDGGAAAGRIVNVSSIVGFTGYSGLSVYGATKASMIGFTRSLAREVGRLGITVNAVAPGFIDTEMTHGLAGEQREQVMRRSALRRLAEVDDVADAVEFLLGDKAREHHRHGADRRRRRDGVARTSELHSRAASRRPRMRS